MRRLIVAVLLAASAAATSAQTAARPVADAFQGLSPEGRRLMTEAHLGARDPAAREALATARERTLAVLETDPLDAGALRAALEAEANLVRTAADAQRERMFAAYMKLSPADRKAYVEANRRSAKPR